ncbi:LysR family transcriptional regulator [Virgibacillus necropolis]|uniref:LysR family transcriptional regulator n=1 Tax=Virgibacillus necropolis TaxID=163877 RepID=A0A221MGR4_9BACI|nr:LysR family transcriptional regulator [Virgibacillus necropolis]ASN06824.1 LysR family transcriptional regulator [Virgibacillus necropolis]
MNIESLKMFCLVVEEGTISQAARKSYVSQPAVTRQIHLLEDKYGTLLFERTEGILKTTEAGKVLYPFAKTILESIEHSLEYVQASMGDYHINLRIGGTLTIGEYLLPKLLGQFKKEFPEVKLILEIGNTPTILEKLMKNEIDLALIEGVVKSDKLHVEKFTGDELILVCSADHPWKNENEVSIGALANEHLIWREPTSGTRMIIERALESSGMLNKIESYMELGSTQAIKNAVEAGLGISILSKMTVVRELEYGTLKKVEITGINLKRDLWLVRKPYRFRRIGVDKLVKFIRDNV